MMARNFVSWSHKCHGGTVREGGKVIFFKTKQGRNVTAAVFDLKSSHYGDSARVEVSDPCGLRGCWC